MGYRGRSRFVGHARTLRGRRGARQSDLNGRAMSYGLPPGLPFVDAMTPAVLVLAGPVTREEVPGLCEDVRALLGAGGGGGGRDPVVVCDVAGLGPPGLGAVELLARLQLAARRAGGRIRLREPAPALLALLALVGLTFEIEAEIEGEGEREAEQREPALRVEEAVEPGDPAL
ncbi:ABC-type transporter Mla MlaB component [Streptomyces turgidiscabies]|uniref:ABC-type transporter Mla MlaB component n=1 Tax=Streptomyces turgidiscabies TaxID=85558 RepID=A0ABU0RJM2_9ACTN|nr:ABC-type transporter Mla MlaB component [Streptomyces turgidiscabies]